MNRCQMLDMINKVSFAMDDTRLFLDTHCDCHEAHAYFRMLSEKRKMLIKEYSKMYGPITAYGSSDDNHEWSWNKGPLPWEFGGSK